MHLFFFLAYIGGVLVSMHLEIVIYKKYMMRAAMTSSSFYFIVDLYLYIYHICAHNTPLMHLRFSQAYMSARPTSRRPYDTHEP